MTRFVKAFEQSGISEFVGSRTDFGGSDSPLSKDEYDKADQRCGSPVWNLPMVFGPIAIAYNVNGLTSLKRPGTIPRSTA